MRYIAYWSDEQFRLGSGTTQIYANEEGKEIEVTGICRTDEEFQSIAWKDKRKLGIVTRYIRPGRAKGAGYIQMEVMRGN